MTFSPLAASRKGLKTWSQCVMIIFDSKQHLPRLPKHGHLTCLWWSACSQKAYWSEISCVHLPLNVYASLSWWGLRTYRDHRKCICVLTTFEFGICLWPVFTSHLPPCCYIFPPCLSSTFSHVLFLFLIAGTGHVFMSSKTSPVGSVRRVTNYVLLFLVSKYQI